MGRFSCLFCMSWKKILFFFFKQKTAYEMRISDWSSDVCSSDRVEILAVEKIIDEDEGVGRIGTRVETDRRSGPVRRELALDLVMERPRTIAHPEHQRPAGFAPDDIGVGLALFLADVLDQPRQALRTLAEDAFGGTDQIVLLVGRAIRSEQRPGGKGWVSKGS